MMHIKTILLTSILFLIGLFGLYQKEKMVTVYLIGDSTMADYANYGEDYRKTRYPVTGWGQVFHPFMDKNNIGLLDHLIQGDSIQVDDRARGGRSTRTFFEEGRWSLVHQNLQPGDLVLIQFGHNDAAEDKPERFVNPEGYKEYIRLFVRQSREKGGIPIVLTPVSRNYPWKEGRLGNVHGLYYEAAVEVAKELDALLIDLTQLSMDYFTEKGQEYVTERYFMNFGPGRYEAYPEGSKDNTHFQPEGAKAVAGLVYKAMVELKSEN